MLLDNFEIYCELKAVSFIIVSVLIVFGFIAFTILNKIKITDVIESYLSLKLNQIAVWG